MNGFICTKALTLSGARYEPGDPIPSEAVLPSRVRALTKQGYIAAQAEAAATPAKEGGGDAAELQQQIAQLRELVDSTQTELQEITSECDSLRERLAVTPAEPADGHQAQAPIVIPLTRDGGVYEVLAPYESLLAATSNLQLTAEAGIENIKTMDDETALILIHGLDSRVTVKKAAQARAEELEKAKEEGTGKGA